MRGDGGSDPGGTTWADAYDNATVHTVGVTQDVINGVYRLAALLEMTGFNHGQADSASPPGQTVVTADRNDYNKSVTLGAPTSAAGGSGATPAGRGLISTWSAMSGPTATRTHCTQLRRRGRTRPKSVASAGHLVPSAVAAISTQVSPEVANATRACSGMGTRIGELSAAYSSMSVACNDYAKHLDEAHSQVIDELLDLLAWIVALEAKWLPRTGT